MSASGWGYWGWGLWFWVFWAVIILLVVWAIPRGRITRRMIPYQEHLLRQRYARGEITRVEFEQRLNDLRRNSQPGARA
jgi:uncharacterized membrane protein